MRRRVCVVLIAGLAALAAAQRPAPKSGIDLSAIDTAVRPQDDLFRFANGRWLAATEIPADRVMYGTFIELADRVELDLRAIIESAGASRRRSFPVRQIVDLYASMVNEARLEALGLDPIRPELRRIDAIASTKDLSTEIGNVSSINAGGPFGGSLVEDARAPGVPVVQISQGGTLLPDRDYYVSNQPEYVAARDQYTKYLTTIFDIVGRADGAAAARAVLALETSLAEAQWSQVESRDPRKTANRFVLGDLPAQMPGFDWLAWGAAQGFRRRQPIVLMQPSFFKRFAALMQSTPLDTWKAWLTARYLTAIAPYVHRPLDMARFEFFGRAITGQTEPRARWKRGVSLVTTLLGDALGQRYVEEHFPKASKTRAEKLVANVVAAFRQALDECSWMTPATKLRALDKLSKLSTRVGYPNRWRSYRGLVVKPDDLLGNVQRSERFESVYRRLKVGQPMRSGEWLMTPQTVNAYYAPAANEIALPAAVLQPPLFDPDADDAVNYGAIGAIIGHEIGHGFDERGRWYDGRGAVRDWWKEEDVAAFQAVARPLVDQFGAQQPIDGVPINGELTFAENSGDLGGLSIALRAYRLSLGGRPAPTIDGFTGEQRFFLSWARVWRGKVRDDFLRQWLLAIPHAPPEQRVNVTVGNVPAFHEAFGVKAGDRLYRPPQRRVKIW